MEFHLGRLIDHVGQMAFVRLSINYSAEDGETVEEIGSLCNELGLEYSLDERNDWLMRAFHREPEGATHLLVIVSPATVKSLWVPFQLGRAEEHGISILPYLTYSALDLPQFLQGRSCIHGIEALRTRLRP